MEQDGYQLSIRKTDKIRVDESNHSLPPDLGEFQEYHVADYHCPEEWSKDGVFIAAKEDEPLWIDFRSNDECAVLPSIQRLNPVTGESINLEDGITKEPTQNYLCLPIQRWLDGYAKDGKVYQFVVTKAGVGLAVNEYVLPEHMQDSHALGFAFFAPKVPKPKPARFEPIHHWVQYNTFSGYKKRQYGWSDPIYEWSTLGDGMMKGLTSKQVLSIEFKAKIDAILKRTGLRPTLMAEIMGLQNDTYRSMASHGAFRKHHYDKVEVYFRI